MLIRGVGTHWSWGDGPAGAVTTRHKRMAPIIQRRRRNLRHRMVWWLVWVIGL